MPPPSIWAPRRLSLAALATSLIFAAACSPGADPSLPPPPTVHPSFKADIPAPLPSGRLPDTARPRRCAVDLEIDPGADRFRGDVYIDVILPRPTSAVVLHGAGLNVIRAEIVGATGRIRAETSLRKAVGAVDEKEELILLPLQDVPAGEAVLHVEYSAPLSRGLRGLYRVDEAGQRFVFSQFEPSDARRMMPCFDEPAFKIPYTVRVTVPKGNLAVSNGRERGRIDSEDGQRTTFVFATTPPVPSYLLGIAVGPFEVREGPVHPVPIRLLTTRGKSRLGAFALETAERLLGILGEYFDRSYPYDKLDLVAVPDFAPGGMENAGLVTFREELLLVDPEAGSAQARRSVASVMAHELAHQWFGNLVTMAWWDDLWLNEGFATHVEAWAVDQYKPTMLAELDLLAAVGDVMDRDALASVRAVRQPVENAYQAEEAFDGITYLKGAGILGMLRHWVGEDAFRAGLQSYLREHEWKNATAEDLLDALAVASDKDVGKIAPTFLDRQGVPVVRAELSCDAGRKPRVRLSQSRYRAGSMSRAATASAPWSIPVCLDYGMRWSQASESACIVLDGPAAELELDARRCPAWLNPNEGYWGYYRYTLPADDLRALGRATRTQDARSQIGFLSNLWSMVRAGEVPAEQLLETLPRFKRATHRRVTEQVIAALDRVSDALVEDEARSAFQRYAASLLLIPARQLGWDARRGDSDDDKLLRRALLAALARLTDDPWLRDGAVRRAQAFLARPASVDPDTAAIALAIAARQPNSGVSVDRLLVALDRVERPDARVSVAAALGSFHDPAQARQAYQLILGTKLRAQDVIAMVRAAGQSSASRKLFLEWLEVHLPQVADRYPGYAAARMLGAVGKLCDRESVAAAGRAFRPIIAELGRGERRLRELLERAELCVALRQQQGPSARAFLERGRW